MCECVSVRERESRQACTLKRILTVPSPEGRSSKRRQTAFCLTPLEYPSQASSPAPMGYCGTPWSQYHLARRSRSRPPPRQHSAPLPVLGVSCTHTPRGLPFPDQWSVRRRSSRTSHGNTPTLSYMTFPGSSAPHRAQCQSWGTTKSNSRLLESALGSLMFPARDHPVWATGIDARS